MEAPEHQEQTGKRQRPDIRPRLAFDVAGQTLCAIDFEREQLQAEYKASCEPESNADQ